MKNFLKSKDFYLALFFACIGVLGIWIMAKHIQDWTGNADFWLPENFNPYDLTEAVSRWSHAVYFTNITLFLFCILTFLNLIAEIFNIQALKKIINNKYLLIGLAVNQVIVMIVFTALVFVTGFEIAPGKYTSGDLHHIGTSLFKHYFITTASIVYVILKKPRDLKFKNCLWLLAYPITYAIITKIVGMTCFAFEWYPYPFFGAKHLWFTLFHTMENFNLTYAILLVILSFLIIAGVYLLLFWLSCIIFKTRPKKAKNT